MLLNVVADGLPPRGNLGAKSLRTADAVDRMALECLSAGDEELKD